MDFNSNLLLMTDSYKMTHWKQYPPGTQHIYSYLEAREPAKDFFNVTFFGLQYLLKKYFEGPVVTKEKIDEANEICNAHFMNDQLFNRSGWEHILDKHGGHLPVSIVAVPEGTPVPRSNVMATIENTDPEVPWLTNYLETLLVQLWYPCTVATLSREIKMAILNAYEKSGCPTDSVDFALHDFGFRGVSSTETAAIGDCAHLVNFRGTDTLAGLTFARKYYNCDMAGYSVPASEHSTMTSWGRANETEAYRNMLNSYPNGIVSVVSDSYDIKNAIENIWGINLKEEVLKRDGTLVVRPDSGDPITSVIQALVGLGKAFGVEHNEAGFKTLHPKVKIIQGDGIDLPMIEKILQRVVNSGFAASNVIFGCGGSLLQKLNRDTCSFAMKCASAIINGEERDVRKEPKTDSNKSSKGGRMKLVFNDETACFETKKASEDGEDVMNEVFRNGEILKEWTLDECRERSFVD